MAYIGNGRTLLVFGPNVQDDIVPDGVLGSFLLSQEVPGGYEGNVLVVRRRYLIDELVTGSTEISFSAPDQIQVLANSVLAAALSVVQVPTTANDTSNIIVTGAVDPLNNGVTRITDVFYDGNVVTITINRVNLVTEAAGASINLSWGRTTEWEVLEPEVDYVIGGVGPNYNQEITFQGGYIPPISDKIYVIHKGDATYNFVPSQASVGPDQLQQNLRNFVCDRYVGNGTATNFALTQEAVNSKTLLVSVDGVAVDGDDPDQSFVGAWELQPNGLSITFDVAPANTTQIKILHLSFSTVSRRASLSPGQIGLLAPGTVDNAALSANSVTSNKIAPGAIETSDLASDAVDGTKILLNNEENLRGKDFAGTPRNILRINASNQTVLNSQADTLLQVAGTTRLRLDSVNSALVSETHNNIALGTAAKKYSALYVQGVAQLGATEVDSLLVNGNTTVSGNVIMSAPGATVDGVDITALQATVIALQAQVLAAVPTGTMSMWMADTVAPTGYLLCQGQIISQATFSTLFSVVGSTFNIGGEGVGNFRLPDMRQRFPLGKAASGTGSLWGAVSGVGGSIDHAHSGGAHAHDLGGHTHNVAGHFHAQDSGVGSTLNISGLSGAHTTTIDISHGHTASSANAQSAITINNGATNISALISAELAQITYNQGFHNHGGSTLQNSAFNTAVGGAHRHTIGNRSGNANVGNPSVTRVLRGGDTDQGGQTGVNLNGTDEGAHPHTIAAGTFNLGINGSGSGGFITQSIHTHNAIMIDPGHIHTISEPNAGAGHSHPVSVNALGATNKIDVSGIHTHAANSFSGSIGNVSGGISGNSAFSTSGPSAANTGSAGVVSTTTNNPPFHTVHFIIKT